MTEQAFPLGIDSEGTPEKQRVAHRTSLISGGVNIVLAALQILIGFWSHSQALVADGVHSLSDLVADIVVLVVNKHSHAAPDEDHHYGHARYENFASLLLGVILLLVGLMMLWRAGERLTSGGAAPSVHVAALGIALLTLVSKEGLFRYMLREAERVRSAMLVANAWHARSDAASSLVVAVGIVANLLGYTYFDAIAAAVVGFLVARMGWTFAWQSVKDLTDGAIEADELAAIEQTLESTPGVVGIHLLRTRKMGDLAIVDAHLLVAPDISVSEGHYIAERAYQNLLDKHEVLDAVIHIDPEDDLLAKPNNDLPGRAEVISMLAAETGVAADRWRRIELHYLDGALSIDLFLPATAMQPDELDTLRQTLHDFAGRHAFISAVRIHQAV
ncbi:MAG: cation transporter [Burkholderiales bacterium]|nr:cation transporter [Burkholderiales bacterium]